MTKPITIAREDFIAEISRAVEESGLPAFMVIDILGVIAKSMQPQIRQQYEADLEAWLQSQEEAEEVKNG